MDLDIDHLRGWIGKEECRSEVLSSALVERFYAISVERRLKHPAVLAISEAARSSELGK